MILNTLTIQNIIPWLYSRMAYKDKSLNICQIGVLGLKKNKVYGPAEWRDG